MKKELSLSVNVEQFSAFLQSQFKVTIGTVLNIDVKINANLALLKNQMEFLQSKNLLDSLIQSYIKSFVKAREIEIKQGIFVTNIDQLGAAIASAVKSNLSIESTKSVDEYIREELSKTLEDNVKTDEIPKHWKELSKESVVRFCEYLAVKNISGKYNDLAESIARDVIPYWYSILSKNIIDFIPQSDSFCISDATRMSNIVTLTYAPREAIKHMLSLESIKLSHIVEQDNLRAVTFAHNERLVIAFRGTDNVANWIRDNADTRMEAIEIKDNKIKVHRGFSQATNKLWDRKSDHTPSKHIQDIVKEYLAEHPNGSIYISGHSLGGAMASITYLYLLKNNPYINKQQVQVYTYGQPKWCATESINDIQNLFFNNYYRIIVNDDLVPSLYIKSLFECSHIGKLYNITDETIRKESSDLSKSSAYLVLDHLSKIISAMPDSPDNLSDLPNEAFNLSIKSVLLSHSMSEYMRKLQNYVENDEMKKMPADDAKKGFIIPHNKRSNEMNKNKENDEYKEDEKKSLSAKLDPTDYDFSDAKDKDIVVFLGNTKAGKSTVINYIIGNPLQAVWSEELEKYVLKKEKEDSRGPKIGLNSGSETTRPTGWNSELIGVIFDTPGFGDNRGEDQDIINALSIKNLLQVVRSAKFVLISDFADLYGESTNKFISLIQTTQRMIPDTLVSGISIIFTKVNEKFTVEKVSKLMSNKIKGNALVEHFIKNKESIGITKRYTEADVGKPILFKDDDIGNVIKRALPIDRKDLSKIKPGISDKSQLFLLRNYEDLCKSEDFEEILKEITKYYKGYVQQIKGADEITTQKTNKLSELLTTLETVEYKAYSDINELLDNLQILYPMIQTKTLNAYLEFIKQIDELIPDIKNKSIPFNIFKNNLDKVLLSIRKDIVREYRELIQEEKSDDLLVQIDQEDEKIKKDEKEVNEQQSFIKKAFQTIAEGVMDAAVPAANAYYVEQNSAKAVKIIALSVIKKFQEKYTSVENLNYCIKQEYDNAILNHPEFLQKYFAQFGSEATLELIDLVGNVYNIEQAHELN